MQIISHAFGIAVTNCYILKIDGGEVVIDAGQNSYEWVKQNTTNILAILSTHGHFDHIYDNYKFQKDGVRVYAPKDDAFMMENDFFDMLENPCKPDILVGDGDEFEFGEIRFKFHHFPGHTPGCSMIEIKNLLFSGDFIFKNSIGRYDFPFSNANEMKNSLLKLLKWDKDYRVYPGHGASTTLKVEQANIRQILKHFG
ncbi:MAG: MBL fold metallo-hydrolase [Campylobacter sp.]|nr:MBL fold metallo-hydrolase [Campylobacter sp.]